jgi:DNA polymerase III subunit epsilon
MKLAFIDTETTGLDPVKNAIIQIAGYIEIDGECRERFNIRMKPAPGKIIEEAAMVTNGITGEEMATFDEHTVGYKNFVQSLGMYVNKFDKQDKFYFVAYNATFDDRFVRQFMNEHGDPYFGSWFHWPSIDVAVLAARELMGVRETMPNFKLVTVAKEYEIAIDEKRLHDAMYDIELTREIYRRIVA